MDPAFHIVSGIVLSQVLPENHIVAGIIATNFPDLLSAPYVFGVKAIKARKDTFAHFIEDVWRGDLKKTADGQTKYPVYHAAHNLFALSAVTIGTYIIARQYTPIIFLGYLIHLLSDVPSHEKDFATRLLYPLSNWHMSWGKSWTNNRKVLFGMWALLLIISMSLVIPELI